MIDKDLMEIQNAVNAAIAFQKKVESYDKEVIALLLSSWFHESEYKNIIRLLDSFAGITNKKTETGGDELERTAPASATDELLTNPPNHEKR